MTPEDEVQLIQIRRVVEGLGWVVVSTEKTLAGMQIAILKEKKPGQTDTNLILPEL